MKKLVYISHPSSGLEENTKKLEDIISTLYSYEEIRDKYTFVSPVHTYGFMYHTVDYETGLKFCTDLLEHCEEVWVFGNYEISTGCKREIALAKELGIKLRIFNVDSAEETKKLVESGEYYSSKHKALESPTNNKVYSRTKMVYGLISGSETVSDVDINDYILNHLLYSDINTALKLCTKGNKDDKLIIIEVELDTSKTFDMTSNYDIQLLHNYIKYRNAEPYVFIDNSKENIDKFMLDMKDTFNSIRRVKECGNPFKSSSIPECVIEAYSIYSIDCVRRIKLFNSQIKNILEGSFIIGDIS